MCGNRLIPEPGQAGLPGRCVRLPESVRLRGLRIADAAPGETILRRHNYHSARGFKCYVWVCPSPVFDS
jgi:hypothetical protein